MDHRLCDRKSARILGQEHVSIFLEEFGSFVECLLGIMLRLSV